MNVKPNECRVSIVDYRSPYHWLRKNYELKVTFRPNQQNSRKWVGKTRAKECTLRRRKDASISFVHQPDICLSIWKWGRWVRFQFLNFVMPLPKMLSQNATAFEVYVSTRQNKLLWKMLSSCRSKTVLGALSKGKSLKFGFCKPERKRVSSKGSHLFRLLSISEELYE